jgi:hypothetical protein
MKKFIYIGLVLLGIVCFSIVIVNINLNNSNDNSTNLLLIKNREALTQEGNNQFIYRIDHESCSFYVSSNAQVGIIHRLFGLGANANAYVDLTDVTRLYTPGGVYRLKDDVTCSDVFDKILSSI